MKEQYTKLQEQFEELIKSGKMLLVSEALNELKESKKQQFLPKDSQRNLFLNMLVYLLNLENYFIGEITQFTQDIYKYLNLEAGWEQFDRLENIVDSFLIMYLLVRQGHDVPKEVIQKKFEKFLLTGGAISQYPHNLFLIYESLKAQSVNSISTEYIQKMRALLKEQDFGELLSNLDSGDVLQTNPSANNMISERNLVAPLLRKEKILKYYITSHLKDGCLYKDIQGETFLRMAILENVQLQKSLVSEQKIMSDWVSENLNDINLVRVPSTYFIAYNLASHPHQIKKRLVFEKVALWAFALDDVLDGVDMSIEEFDIFKTTLFDWWEFASLTMDSLTLPFQKELWLLCRCIKEVIQEISFEFGSEHEASLIQRVQEYINTQIEDGYYKVSKGSPSFEKYMKYTHISVGVPLVLDFVFRVGEVGGEFIVTDEYEYILYKSGELLRYLNDLGTYKRDIKEKNLNAVDLLASETNITYIDAVSKILNWYEEGMNELYQQIYHNVDVGSYQSKLMAFNICRTSGWFYNGNDFHQYAKNIPNYYQQLITEF